MLILINLSIFCFNLVNPNDSFNSNNSRENISDDASYYDFIIVGSGSAGSVLANRLSEIKNWKILLLEAGNRANILTKVPIFSHIFSATDYSWNFTSEEQPGMCEGIKGKACPCPKGKALGGSTVINFLFYSRPNPQDHARWSTDNKGWSYEEVLPYYLKMENCRLSDKICSNKFRSRTGKMSVEHPYSSVFTNVFLEAGHQMHLNTADYNSPQFMGFSRVQASLYKGRRQTVADVYLEPILERPNLKILTAAMVTKILIDPLTKEAFGVEYIKNGKKCIAISKREVVLSAGTFNSPQLLMISGIGPSDHMQELGICPITNLPVGQRMIDHMWFPALTFKINQTVIPSIESLLDPIEIAKFLGRGEGIYSSILAEVIGMIKTNTSEDIAEYPNIELILTGSGIITRDYGIVSSRVLRLNPDIYEKVFEPIVDTPVWTAIPVLIHPKSTGYLKLRSKSPYDFIKVYSNFFTDPEGYDLKTLISGIRFCIELSETSALQQFGSILHDIPIPGCEEHTFNGDEYWECVLRNMGISMQHQIGTCKMGRRNDPFAVVDERCRVHGVGKLRVADASVIPVSLSSHTNAVTIMIGEKVSDLIKKEHGEI